MPDFVRYYIGPLGTQRSQVSFPSRRVRQRRRRLILVPLLFFFILIVIFYTLGSESRTQGRNLQNYLSQTNDLISGSNKIGQDFIMLTKNPSSGSRKLFERRLSKYIEESEVLKEKGGEVEPPKDLKEAHIYFKISLDLRVQGLRSYKSSLLNALESRDIEVTGGQVSRSLKDLALSDKAYEYFKSQVEKALQESKVKAKVARSQFIKNPLIYEKSRVLSFLAELRGREEFVGRHELRIADITTDPQQVSYNPENDIAILPGITSMDVIIMVENQGNKREREVKLTVELASEAQPQVQRKEKTIKSIAPGKKELFTLSGFRATPGSLNLIKATVDPVPGEKDTNNNTQEYKFVLRE